TWDSQEKGIIYWTFEDYWTWGEYFQGIQDMMVLASETSYERIDIICDLRPSKHFPINILKNVQLGSPKTEEEAKTWGITVVIGTGKFVNLLYTLLCRINRFLAEHYFLAETMEEAHQLIEDHRQHQSKTS